MAHSIQGFSTSSLIQIPLNGCSYLLKKIANFALYYFCLISSLFGCAPCKIASLKFAQMNGGWGGVGLKQLRNFQQKGQFDKIRTSHFDWWLFPIDRGSKNQGDLYKISKKDFKRLSKDSAFMHDYFEGIEIVLFAWGWNLKNKSKITSSQQVWDGYGIRLAKMANSLQLFIDNSSSTNNVKKEAKEALASLQKFYRRVVLPSNNCSDLSLVQKYLGSSWSFWPL